MVGVFKSNKARRAFIANAIAITFVCFFWNTQARIYGRVFWETYCAIPISFYYKNGYDPNSEVFLFIVIPTFKSTQKTYVR